MSGIKRWDVETMDERTSSEGRWVLHSDHEAEVARMRAELHSVKEHHDGYCEAASEHLAELRAELEAYRKDAERRLDLIRATLENTEWRHGARNIHAELCREVDAAMGASA